jgi:RND family efflux transporter MFP subunit
MQARYQSAKAALSQSQAAVNEAATLKGYTVVRAPAAGVVAERQTAVGDLAQPGQTLASLYDPDRLQVEGEVNDSYREQVKVGEAAQVSVPAVKFEAQMAIAEIFPISAPGSRTFKVRTGKLQNPALVPGMFARLMLPLGHSRGILIPQTAVSTVGQLTMVQVAADRTAQLRQVKLGQHVGEQVEVLAGLKAGDRIILPE